MAALNQAKIINALETIVDEAREDFIFSFLLAYGMPKATIKRLQMGDKQRNVAQVAGDVAVAQKIYFHPLQKGEDPQGSLERILALPLIAQHKIRFVMVTDFKTVLAYDGKVDDFTEFDFDDFKTNFEFFLPLTGQYEKAVAYAEHPADVKACEKMGRLYDSIQATNHYESDDLHTLNVFLTRLLFCFFAEDTGIFPQSNQMTHAVKSLTKEDGSDLTEFFETLFTVLNLPDQAPERKDLSATFQTFPYVNGGLFAEHCRIPKFDSKARRLLLDCGNMSWRDISPVIFGSMFQAVMDPEKRRSLGAHYTSEKNILKVVRPLFLDALYEEFEQIAAQVTGKRRSQALKNFQKKLSSLGFLDPACGCGNFLVVSYRELRELELKVLLAIRKDEPPKTQVMDVRLLSKVTINQFYGIELEEFPVEIARVSMWLMEHVMNVKFGEAFGSVFPSIPLQHSAEIVCANALAVSWDDLFPVEKLHYILGNPPFGGARVITAEQKDQLMQVFSGVSGASNLDYVTAWYKKTADVMRCNAMVRAAFVSTNSICQGEQVAILWQHMLNAYGIKIHFAYRTFKWGNEARGNAAVHCVIVGFGRNDWADKMLYNSDGNVISAKKINGYLVEAADVFIENRKFPLCDIPKVDFGNMPNDAKGLLSKYSNEEKNDILRQYPEMTKWFRLFWGADEFINGIERWCLWLKDAEPSEINNQVFLRDILQRIKDKRLGSKRVATKILAETPHLFGEIRQPKNNYILIPRHSSEKRKYIPIGFISPDIISGDSNIVMPNATLYHFGILTSLAHMTWMRTVCGRLKSDYRYSASLVYNTFPWPTPTGPQKKHIETLAENILLTREMYPDMTLADMYDPDKMPEPLREAHTALDIAVDALYRKKPFASDEERLQLLFALYEKLVAKNPQNEAANIGAEDASDDN
ncbi:MULTISPECIES: DNA methyltransferase [unclassified Desulfovibrio]|uniref:DNA methyltransferase n=1 Tax=unclassified Desulfovibrio TaxID=2593640 RepID=UPI002FDAECDD